MGLMRRIRHTAFGDWLARRARGSRLGPGVQAVADVLVSIEHRLIALWPRHRAHDRRQAQVLDAFKAQDPARSAPGTQHEPRQ